VLSYTLNIPTDILFGQHSVDVSFALLSGGLITQRAMFSIPESSLILEYSGAKAIIAGDILHLKIANAGGVDTTYSTEKLVITDNHGAEASLDSLSGHVEVGAVKFEDIKIPSQTARGAVILTVQLKDTKTGKIASIYQPLNIDGIETTLNAVTDKNMYLSSETVSARSIISNGAFNIENGILDISVVRYIDPINDFTHFLPKIGWWSFYFPESAASGPDGSIYIMDLNYQIQKFDANGNFITKWGSYGSSNGQFQGVGGLAVGSDGFVYVADRGNCRVQKFDSSGAFIVKWGSCGSGDSQFNYPYGVAVGPDGSVYVVDTGNNRIQKFSSTGNFLAKWGSYGTGNGQFSAPRAMAVGSDGTMYVVDTGNNRMQMFSSSRNYIAKWGSYGNGNAQFYSPQGIAIGPDGNVFVADRFNYRVQKFSSTGIFITKWGSIGRDNGLFYSPMNVVVGSGGLVYVVDRENHRIQKFDSSGTFISKWGACGNGSGEFCFPNGVAMGPDGLLYVVDAFNKRE